MNVIADFAQRLVVPDHHRFVSTLIEVAIFVAQAIEAGAEGGLQPMHPFDDIGFWCSQSEMKMVSHYREAVKDPGPIFTRFEQARFKG